jgi:hypothetical protein
MGHPTFQFADTTLSCLLPRGVGLSLSCVAICLMQLSLLKSPLVCSFKPSSTMVRGTLSQWKGQGLMLSDHGVSSCPAKGGGVYQSTLISTVGRCASKHSVCKSCMWESLIAKHPVIGWKSSCKRGVQASADTPLHGPLHSLFGVIRGNHPLACKGHEVYWRNFVRLHMPTQA